jgi:signal transduction histidine kinase
MKLKLRVLHLEDDSDDAELIRATLSAEGIDCDTVRVETRDDFIKAITCDSFDMIFADYSLPSFDGLEALKIAKERCPDTPFIFVSGKMGEELAIDTLKGGATDYVVKQRLARLAPSVLRALREIEERAKLREAEEEVRRHQDHLEELVRERTVELEKVNEELRASYQDMESFSYSASHDLRSPLIVIDGFSRILLEDYGDKLDDNGRHLLKTVRENAGKMAQLIEDLLAFARVSTKEVNKSEIDMKALAETTFGELSHDTGGGNVQFRVNNLLPACGDRPMIRQVFVNLLSNAVKFTAHNAKAVIEIGGSRSERGNVYFVKDDGAGFDMKYSGKLYGLFQRAHSHKEFKGTGVGLAIVKRIIEKHGGHVWAEGAPGSGATFYFSLPDEGSAGNRIDLSENN